MITFTKEQLIASAHARIEFAEMMLAGELEPLKERTWSIELELARIALASLEAEADDGREQFEAWFKFHQGDEHSIVTLHRANGGLNYRDPHVDLAWIAWKDSRAAMLQGAEPVTTAYKLPDGWVLMPVEPTKEMIDAGWSYYMTTKSPSSLGVYGAMLAAAPEQEVK